MANKVRFVDPGIIVQSNGSGGGGSSISSSYALSASYADFSTSASYADYALSASHEIVKELSSSYADTASFAQSGEGPFTGSFTGSFIGDGTGLFSGSFSGSIPDAYQIISGSASASISPDNGLQINSSVDVKGDIEATGVISASKFSVSSSTATLPGYTFWHQDNTGMLSTGPGYLQFQVAGGGSPELELNVGTVTFRVNAAFSGKEISGPTRIRGLGSITGSNFELPISGNLIVDGAITGSAGVTNPLTSSYAITASHALNTISSSYSNNATSASYAITASYAENAGGDAFPYSGSAKITGSLIISGSNETIGGSTISKNLDLIGGGLQADGTIRLDTLTDGTFGSRIMFGSNGSGFSIGRKDDSSVSIEGQTFIYGFDLFSLNVGSNPYLAAEIPDGILYTNKIKISGSNIGALNGAQSESLSVHGSGSTVFNVIGSEGTLLSIDDELDETVFTANDRTGLPILEVSASGEVWIGKSPQSLYTTAIISSTSNAVTQSIFGLSTSSYDGAFFDYTVQSGSNARAGSIMSVWNGSTINFTETTTLDIGNTSGFNLIVHISQSQAQIAQHSDTNGYKIKTIIRSI